MISKHPLPTPKQLFDWLKARHDPFEESVHTVKELSITTHKVQIIGETVVLNFKEASDFTTLSFIHADENADPMLMVVCGTKGKKSISQPRTGSSRCDIYLMKEISSLLVEASAHFAALAVRQPEAPVITIGNEGKEKLTG